MENVRAVRRLVPLALLLAGCGGGGGGGSSSDGLTRLTVAWPDRTKAFAGSPLAQSAIVRFQNAVTSATVATFPLVRPDGTSATTKTYVLPDKVAAGTYLLSVLFCAGTDAQAANAVGFGSSSVIVGSDGTLRDASGKTLGDVAFTSSLASVAVTAGQTLLVGQRTSLLVSATTQGGGAVAVPYAEVSLTVTGGGSALQANDDGTVTGLAAGTATVVAKAFGVTSAAQTVAVTQLTP